MSSTRPDELIDADDSVFAIVDVQEWFFDRLEPSRREGMVERIAFLARSARWCGIPIIACAERADDWGYAVHPEIAAAVPGLEVLPKETFALADDEVVFPALERIGRRTAVLCGLETDVCAGQSALSLLGRGYRVFCVVDAVGSPGSGHGHGLERMRTGGVLMVGTKQLHYEWMRTVSRARAFRAAHPHLSVPPGMVFP